MNEFQLDASEALNDALDMLALKEKENAMLKIQINALVRKFNENSEETEVTEKSDDTV